MAQLRGTKIYGDLAVLPGVGSDVSQLGSASITKDLSVGGKLNVTGSTELAEDLLVKKGATVEENATFKKDVTVEGNLVVNEKVTIKNNLEVEGNLTYIDTENLRVKDQLIELNTDGEGNPAQASLTSPAGIDILGAKNDTTASIHYDPKEDIFTLNKRLKAEVTLNNKLNFDATSSTVDIQPGYDQTIKYTRDEALIKSRVKVEPAENTNKEFDGSQNVKVIIDFTDIDERIDRLVMQKDVEHVMTTGDTMTGDLYMKSKTDNTAKPELNTGVTFEGKAKIVYSDGELQFLFGEFEEPKRPTTTKE